MATKKLHTQKYFKIHIRAGLDNTLSLLRVAFPYLINLGIPFKVAGSLEILRLLNAGFFDVSQIGKFITIYPSSEALLLGVVDELNKIYALLQGPSHYLITVSWALLA